MCGVEVHPRRLVVLEPLADPPDENPHARPFIGHVELSPNRPRLAQEGEGWLHPAFREQDSASGLGRCCQKKRGVECRSDSRQLVGGRTCAVQVAGGNRDLDVRGKQPGARRSSARGRTNDAANRSRGGIGFALGQPQQR
jgi:hypothetical protein